MCTKVVSKKIKRNFVESSGKDAVALSNVHILNDNCLIHIFQYLSFLDRFKIEYVCKRWNRVVKLSWSDVKTLKLCQESQTNYILYSNLEKNTCFILSVIQRCKVYLNNVELINDLDVSYLEITKKISECCQNLNSLNLKQEKFYLREICTKEDVNLLFKNNIKLSKICLHGLKLDSQFLTYLNTYKVIEFQMSECYMDSSNCYLFSKFKNLKIFQSFVYNDTCNDIVNALCKSKCENITKFFAWANKGKCFDNLSKFLANQKKLSTLAIYSNMKVNKESSYYDKLLLRSLNKNMINYLDLKVNEKITCHLKEFKNLTTLFCRVDNLTNQIVLDVLECINLKKIGFFLNDNGLISLTSEGKKYFENFSEIETFDFMSFKKQNVDSILKAISKCSKLTTVGLNNTKLTKASLKSICSIPSLKELDISATRVTKKDLINIVVDKALKLEKINYKFCYRIGHKTLRMLNDKKIKRGDTHVLEIHSYEVGIENNLGVKRLIKESLVDKGLISLKIKTL